MALVTGTFVGSAGSYFRIVPWFDGEDEAGEVTGEDKVGGCCVGRGGVRFNAGLVDDQEDALVHLILQVVGEFLWFIVFNVMPAQG